MAAKELSIVGSVLGAEFRDEVLYLRIAKGHVFVAEDPEAVLQLNLHGLSPGDPATVYGIVEGEIDGIRIEKGSDSETVHLEYCWVDEVTLSCSRLEESWTGHTEHEFVNAYNQLLEEWRKDRQRLSKCRRRIADTVSFLVEARRREEMRAEFAASRGEDAAGVTARSLRLANQVLHMLEGQD
jgi:uncharacterized protein YukE